MPAEAFYSLDSGYHASHLEVAPRAFALIAAERARKIQPYLAPGASVFEFGVGTGLNLALTNASRKAGCDVGTHLAAGLRALGIEYRDLGAVAGGSFDVVLSHHSLEHVASPHDTLRELRRILRPGGTLLVYVPFEKERRYRRYDPREPNHHLYSWNVQTLGSLVAVCGFTVESCVCGPTGYERFAARAAARIGLGGAGYRLLLRALRLAHQPEEIRLIARKDENE
jgi:SAM-dependent methyltransferase